MIYNANASWNYRIAAHCIASVWSGSHRMLTLAYRKRNTTKNAEQRTKSQAAYNSCPCWPSCCRGVGWRGGRGRGGGTSRLRVCQSVEAHARAERLIQNFVGLHLRAIEQQSINRIESINRYTSVHAPRLHNIRLLHFQFQFRFWFHFQFQFQSFILRLYEKNPFL